MNLRSWYFGARNPCRFLQFRKRLASLHTACWNAFEYFHNIWDSTLKRYFRWIMHFPKSFAVFDDTPLNFTQFPGPHSLQNLKWTQRYISVVYQMVWTYNCIIPSNPSHSAESKWMWSLSVGILLYTIANGACSSRDREKQIKTGDWQRVERGRGGSLG